MSGTVRPLLLLARAQLAARGVSTRGVLGYLLVWAAIGLASQVSISVLGIRLAPPGSSSLDTVAITMLVLPAALLAHCLPTRTPELDRTRSRPRQPSAALWAAGLGAVAAVSPVAVAWLLHPAFSTRHFYADWYLAAGLCLLLGSVLTTTASAVTTLAVLATFSAPGVVPWKANVFYNLDLDHVSVLIGMALLAAAVVLAGARPGTSVAPDGARVAGRRVRAAGSVAVRAERRRACCDAGRSMGHGDDGERRRDLRSDGT